MERSEVYKIIDQERKYQDSKWTPDEHGNHEVEAYMLYMHSYLQEAMSNISRTNGTREARDILRKVVALGVACFEKHGVPDRYPRKEGE